MSHVGHAKVTLASYRYVQAVHPKATGWSGVAERGAVVDSASELGGVAAAVGLRCCFRRRGGERVGEERAACRCGSASVMTITGRDVAGEGVTKPWDGL